ncbi:MAG: hypothetical protein L3J47_11600 [Sulfurovum sp.]|nr:hypothetical protein [Sulfurovum sp.]
MDRRDEVIKRGSIMKEVVITQEQFSTLQGFMLHIWNCNHGKPENKRDHTFYAEKMDEAGISWYVQNTAAYLMEKRENGWKYFRGLLASRGILVGERYE